jgi:hypothetical protein
MATATEKLIKVVHEGQAQMLDYLRRADARGDRHECATLKALSAIQEGQEILQAGLKEMQAGQRTMQASMEASLKELHADHRELQEGQKQWRKCSTKCNSSRPRH